MLWAVYHRYMHYHMKPYYSLSGQFARGRSQQSPHSPREPQPLNDLRCMPVYEELDNAANEAGDIQRQQVRMLRVHDVHVLVYSSVQYISSQMVLAALK